MSLDLWSYYRVHISSEQQGDNCFEKLKSKLSPIAFLMVLSYLTIIHLSFELCNYQVIDFMVCFLISKNCKFYIKFNSSEASTHSVAIAHIHVGLIIASTLEFLVILFLGYNARNKTVWNKDALDKKLICAADSWLFAYRLCLL